MIVGIYEFWDIVAIWGSVKISQVCVGKKWLLSPRHPHQHIQGKPAA